MNNRYIAIFVIIIAIVVGVLLFSYKKDAPIVVPPTPEAPIASSTPTATATSTATTTATTTKPVVKPTPTPVVTPKPTPTPIPTPTPTPTPSVKSYTLSEIAKHNSKTDCWTAVKGKVYDITTYIPKHPGGEKQIMQVCGKDGTFLFEDQHAGDKKPNNILASFEIGILIQ